MAAEFNYSAEEGYEGRREDSLDDIRKLKANEKFNKPNLKRDYLDSLFSNLDKDLLICKLFYFFFFGAFGSLFPLLAVYFKQLAMNPTQSGILIGFRPFIEFCSAPFWGGVADRYKKWKQMLLMAVFCWIVFTLAIAFVKPPAHSCYHDNSTHYSLRDPYTVQRDKRSIEDMFDIYPETYTNVRVDDLVKKAPAFSPKQFDHTKVLNKNESDVEGLLYTSYSTVVYHERDVQDVFFILLILVIVGEFFSAPAITFADSVTLSYLGEDTDNYGRQRMYGSLGWGLAMFFVGLVLENSNTYPAHPCGNLKLTEKNYMVCFAVFTVLMSCALVTATQFRFIKQGGKELQLTELTERWKDRVKKFLGDKKTDRGRLVDDDEYANEYGEQYPPTGPEQTPPRDTLKPVDDNMKISLDKKSDMVTDVVDGQENAVVDERPFFEKWMTTVKLLAAYKYISVIFVAWFMGFGIGLIFTFLFWHLQDLGGGPTLFGVASVFNHVSELLAYFLSSRFIYTFGHIRVLYAGLVGNIARFLYISWLKTPWWVLPFEFVQGLTHAAVWAATCSYITQAVPTTLKSSAQGILQGLHHGLGRGCGAVFGGVMVYQYGSEITFRIYGVTCIFVLAGFVGLNYFFGDPADMQTRKWLAPNMDNETSYFAPHGVPTGKLSRDPSANKIGDIDSKGYYGSTDEPVVFEQFPEKPAFASPVGPRKSLGTEHGGVHYSEVFDGGSQRVLMNNPPKPGTQMYQQQPYNKSDPFYGP